MDYVIIKVINLIIITIKNYIKKRTFQHRWPNYRFLLCIN